MKKLKYIFLSLLALSLAVSCNDDGGDSRLNLASSAVPDIQKAEGSEAIINLLEIQEGNDISISFTADVAQGTISSMDVVGYYFKGDGSVEKAVLANDVTTFPSTVTLNKQQLIDSFEGLSGDADFVLGDQLVITADLTLNDGTVVSMLTEDGARNFGTDIMNSPLYSVMQTYNISCPSDLGGTYSYSTTDVGEPGGFSAAGPFTGTVTLTDNGGGNYSLSDGAFGGWIALYNGDPYPAATGVTLIEICGTLSFGGSDQYGDTYTISEVAVDGANLSFHWENTYGENGDTVLTRTDGSSWPELVSAE